MRNPISVLAVVVLASFSLAACQPKTPAAEPAAPDATAAAPVTPAPAVKTAATGEMCGGVGAIKCASAGDFCEQPTGQCKTTADGAGVCTTKPEVCTKEYVPVCGCDGQTYGNACMARAAGVSVASTGACAKPEPAPKT